MLEKIDQLMKEGGDFAYFCSFEDEEKLLGNERLFFHGQGIPINSIKELRNLAAQPCPVILTFGMVSDIFPNIKVDEESWPNGFCIINTKNIEGSFKRHGEFQQFTPLIRDLDRGYMESVAKSIERIKNGELLQVVLSKEIPVGSISVIQTLEYFLTHDRSAYVFLFKIGRNILMGSSPESLVKLRNKRCLINPIAGTRPISAAGKSLDQLSVELLSDEKELLEHRMLVDLARNDLGKVSVPGTVKVVKSHYIKKFASVIHILSDVESSLREELDAADLLEAVFPAGTVSGAPKERALELILEYEEGERGPYSGAAGIYSNSFLDMALCIRSLYTMNNSIVTRAGAGIVKDSIPENENREILAKAGTVLGGVQNESVIG
jgi:anthranilate synthase component 1